MSNQLHHLPHLPGIAGALAERLRALVEAAGRRGITTERLIARAAPATSGSGPWPGEQVEEALAALQASGAVVEREGRWVALRHTDGVVGVAEVLERGDALLRTGAGGEAGYFIARRHRRAALDGDTVLAQPLKRQPARGRRLPEAMVVQVLERRADLLVGTLEIDDDRRWLVPFDPKIQLELEVEGGEDLLEDQYVVVEIPPPSPRGGRPRGRVREVLGSLDKPGTDVLVLLRHHRIPDEFPAPVTAAAAARPADPAPGDWAGREDLRGQVVVTIDGETARDFDDAISIRERGDGFLLGVHIADVAHYVEEGSALDLEAYRRGTSVYFPERAVPMLPEALSNGLCSLRPGVPRLTLSAFLEIGKDGVVRKRRFAETVIESGRRLTYTEVRRVLEEPAAGDAAVYGPVLPMLRTVRRLMEVLFAARLARGSIDFDLPEGDVILDTDGVMVGVKPGERTVAHRIIEECMIAANEAVAFELFGHDSPALYRGHDPPDKLDLEGLREILGAMGIALKGELENLHPSALQATLRRVEGTPEEPFVSTLLLRAMQRAVYSPDCRGHYALASRYYTHFTSPIRRYPDLVVHRRLKALLAGRAEEEAERTLLPERLPTIAEHSSRTERRAEQAERDLLQWKKVRFLAGRAGERFPGHITGVQPFGLFVQLDGYFVDGFVPIRALADDEYRYEPESHRLLGERSGRAFQLADRVTVELAGVDPRRRSLDLKLADLPPPPAARAGRRGHRPPAARRGRRKR